MEPPLALPIDPRSNAAFGRDSSAATSNEVSELLDQALQICAESEYVRAKETFGSTSPNFIVANQSLTLHFVEAVKYSIVLRRQNSGVKSIHFSNVKILDKSSRAMIEKTLVEALVESRFTLESLTLCNCDLTDQAALDITNNLLPCAPRLVTLDLSGNTISDVGGSALAKLLASTSCNMTSLNLTNSRLTKECISVFCDNVPSFHTLKVLKLADFRHLLPLTLFQKFRKNLETNTVLELLTLGSETMDGAFLGIAGDKKKIAENKMDMTLRYFWLEPAYRAITDDIRLMLRANFAGLHSLLQMHKDNSGSVSLNQLHTLLESVEAQDQLQVCFRVFKLQPELVAALRSLSSVVAPPS
jgi:Leucine Rich repeat